MAVRCSPMGNVRMPTYRTIAFAVSFCSTLLLSACKSDEAINADLRVCVRMEETLKTDKDIALFLDTPVGGAGLKFGTGHPITVTEERFVALNAMIADCHIWARGGMTDDDFSEAMNRSSGVFAASREIDEVNARIALIEKSLSDSQHPRGPNIDAPAVASSAENLGDSVSAMSNANDRNKAASIASVQPEYREIARLAYDLAQLNVRLDGSVGDLQNRVEALRGELAEFHAANDMERRELRKISIVYSVFYETSSATLDAPARRVLDGAIASITDKNRVVVIGYADERGSDSLNLDLSGARSLSVAAYLEAKGIKVDSILAAGRTGVFSKDKSLDRRAIIEISNP